MSSPSKPCPVCSRPPATEYAPFCSRGCKDRDLLKWLGDGYRIPGPALDPDGLDGDPLDGDGLDSNRPGS